MSDPGSIRYTVGGGLLTVANGVLVFLAPDGPLADEWSELALAPATEAELADAVAQNLPPDQFVAVVQLHEGGVAMLHTPGNDRVLGRVQRSAERRIRFGMAPAASSPLWVESGVVAASGFEISGFAMTESSPAPANPTVTEVSPERDAPGSKPHPEPSPDGVMVDDDMTVVDLPVPDPPVQTLPPSPEVLDPPPPPSSPPAYLDLPPPPAPTVLDPPVLSTSLFPDLPTEPPPAETPEAPPSPQPEQPVLERGGNPVIERTPTPPPPGMPAVAATGSPQPGHSVVLVFDDGQNIPLTSTMAVGRAPEGSEHTPPGAVIVVVAGDQVSRCHFVIRPTSSGAEVMDTNSLNGCFVDYPDRPGTGPQIPVGVPVPIEPGQQLRFGDRALTVIAG